ncbi:MAG TPA: hypothetical protein VGY31_13190 [Terriglobia bacterium]|nr:hypothetical protein [Terriglobia bacterium]
MTKSINIVTIGIISLLIAVAAASAQSSLKTDSGSSALIPVKVNVVISEYDGAKEVSVLPYTLSAFASQSKGRFRSSLRMGLNVPITYGSNQITYKGVGTNIDCDVSPIEGGSFEVHVSLQRSSVYPPSSSEAKATLQLSTLSRESAIIATNDPVFGQFNATFDAVLRDGQTKESTIATDPVSGHVIKVDVTLHLVKE